MVLKEKISSERHLCGWKCLVDVRGQRRMGRAVRDDRDATVTQITTRYNQGMQNTISECTTRRTLKQMGYSSRRPHRVLPLSAKNRKQRLQFTQAHKNWTLEDCKNIAWSDESRILLRHSSSLCQILTLPSVSMDPFCLVSMVQDGRGGVMVWGIFSWHTLPLDLLSTNWASFKRHRQPEYCCSNHLKLVSWTLQFHFTQMASTVIRSQSNRAPFGCGIIDVHPTNLQQLRDAIMSILTKISEECFQYLVESTPQIIKAVLKAKGGPTRY